MKKAELNPFCTTTENGLFDIKVVYNGFMTMLDGKVVKVLTDAPSYNTCPMCHYKQSEFDDPELTFNSIDDNIKFGLRFV